MHSIGIRLVLAISMVDNWPHPWGADPGYDPISTLNETF
jgi:hypothetical protein